MLNNFNVYVVYDKVALMPTRVFIFENDRLALRFFDSALRVPNSPLLNNVKDTILVCIGSFNDFLSLTPSLVKFNIESFNDDNKPINVDLNGRLVKEYNDIVLSIFNSKKES